MDQDFFLILAVFLVILVGFAIGLRLLVPIIAQHFKGSGAGWGRLSEVYATTRQPPAQVSRRQSMVVGQVLYRNCMTVGFDDAGLYLELGFPMSLRGKRPLLIPWSEFKRAEESRLFWRKAALLAVGEPLVGTITVPMELYETIRPAMHAPSLQEGPAVRPESIARSASGTLPR